MTPDHLAPYATAAQGSMLVWPAIGFAAGLLFASFHFENPALIGAAIGIYVVGVFVAVALQIKRSGVQPSFGAMPTELKRNLYRFWVASTLLGVGALVIAFTISFLVAGIAVGLGVTAVGIAYHHQSRTITSNLLLAA